MGFRKKNIWRIMTCPGGKRPPRPQKWSNILKIVKIILTKVLEVCLLDILMYALTLYTSCKARFENYKDLGKIFPKVSDLGPKGWHWLLIFIVNQIKENP